MTDRVHPTQGEASSQLTSGAIKWAAQTDWIVPSGEDYLAGFAGMSGTPLNGFTESHSSSSYDVTVDTGEAFVGGRWMARDTTTTVTVASSTNNQTIYAGWESSVGDSVVIGLDSAFSSTDDGRREPIYEVNSDGSGVTGVTTLYDNEPIHPHAANADALNGVDASAFAQVNQAETIEAVWTHNQNIDIASNGIDNVGSVNSPETNATLLLGSGLADASLQTGGGGSGEVRIYDNANNNPIADFEEGGKLHLPNGDLETRRGWMVDHSSPITIQKDGTDGNGVINFKTE